MALYAVRCQPDAGDAAVQLVDADNAQQALALCPASAGPARTARRHWRERLGLRDVPTGEQRLLLAQMSVRLSRGEASVQEYERIIAGLPALRRNRDRRRVPSLLDLAPHEILRHLNAHPFAVALCREGERLGEVPAMLRRAIAFLDLQQRLRDELRGPLLRAGLYTAAALALFAAVPFMFTAALEGLSERVQVRTTLSTDILLGIHALLTDYLWLTAPVLVGAGLLAARLWGRLRALPIACDFDGLARARRGYLLLAILAPSFRQGIHLAELIHSLRGLLGRACGDHLHRRLRAGERLSASLSERHFTRSLTSGLQQFEDTPAEHLEELFDAVQTNLRAEVGWYAERVVRWTRWFYSLLMFTLLLLMVRGFLLPIYSLSLR